MKYVDREASVFVSENRQRTLEVPNSTQFETEAGHTLHAKRAQWLDRRIEPERGYLSAEIYAWPMRAEILLACLWVTKSKCGHSDEPLPDSYQDTSPIPSHLISPMLSFIYTRAITN